MSLGAPTFAWMFLVAAPIVAFYILRVRRRAATVPYLRLWETLLTETRARSLFERLKRWISLLLQLLILSGLVFALTRPRSEAAERRAEHVVLVLDTSASLQALEEGDKRRFDLALDKAREIVGRRDSDSPLMVVAASDRVEILCPFTKNRLILDDALAKARVTSRPLDPERALAFAREMTRGLERPRIVFVSDGNAGGVRTAIGTEKDAELAVVGAARDNVGILRFAARKSTSLATDYVLAEVKNFGEERATVSLQLSLNGRLLKSVPVEIAPGATDQQRFELALPEGGTLELALEHPAADGAAGRDALALDDKAYAVVRPSVLQRVMLVAKDEAALAPFRIAFSSMSEVVDETSMGVTLEEYTALEPDLKRADVTVFAGMLPAELPAEGNLVLIHTDVPASLPAEIASEEAAPVVWDWQRDHLVNRYLNWRDLPLPPARILKLAGGESAVQSYEGPLVSLFDLGSRRAIYIGFDVTARLFPFRLAFPILLRNALAWFDVDEEIVLADTYSPGAPITPLVRLPGDSATATWFEGGGQQTQALPLARGRFYFDHTEECGPVVFAAGGREHATSVNLFDARESGIAPDEAGPEAQERESRAAWFGGDLWALLALAALALWVLEWATYHRRLTE